MLLISRRFLAFQWVDGYYKTEIVSEKKKVKKRIVENTNAYGLSCPGGACATIKQHISTPVVHPLIAMVAEHVLVSHGTCNFIVNA